MIVVAKMYQLFKRDSKGYVKDLKTAELKRKRVTLSQEHFERVNGSYADLAYGTKRIKKQRKSIKNILITR